MYRSEYEGFADLTSRNGSYSVLSAVLTSTVFIQRWSKSRYRLIVFLQHLLFVKFIKILGFHEGVANAILLSVYNPIHLHRVGLFNNNTDTYEMNINFLMNMALQKLAYAPYAFLLDQVK